MPAQLATTNVGARTPPWMSGEGPYEGVWNSRTPVALSEDSYFGAAPDLWAFELPEPSRPEPSRPEPSRPEPSRLVPATLGRLVLPAFSGWRGEG